MDQTSKVQPQQGFNSVQNNPESQKGFQKPSNNENVSLKVQSISEKRGSQNASQNGSRSMSQSGSQMDQQILGGLSKKQKRRYTTFLQALGIDVQGKLSKKQEWPIYDSSNPPNQQIEPKLPSKEKKQQVQSYSEIHLNRQGLTQENQVLDGENHILAQKKSEFGQIQTRNSQINGRSINMENKQKINYKSQLIQNKSSPNQYLEVDLLQGREQKFFEQMSKISQSNVITQKNQICFNNSSQVHENQINDNLDQVFKSPRHQKKQSELVMEINATFRPAQNPLFLQSHYQSQDGEMSMENNFDPFSNSKPFSEINYDVINSIYTPVSHFKVPIRNPDEIFLDEKSSVISEQPELTIVMEEFRKVVEQEKDVEIDGPSRHQEERNFEINAPSPLYEVYQEKDVEIDGPTPIYQNFQQKDVEIDGPSHPYQAARDNFAEFDGQSSIYRFSEGNAQIQDQIFASDFLEKRNPPMEIQIEEKPMLQVIRKNSNFNKIYEKEEETLHQLKRASESNQKAVIFSKPKKNSLSMVFQNKELNKTAEGPGNRRKFSESSRSAGLNSVNNKVTSNKRSNELSEQNQSSFMLGQSVEDSKEYNLFQSSNDKILSIEEQNEPHESIKMTPNANSFSNRSDKSVKSKRSNRFSDEVVNQKQVPPLESLQMIKDGKEPRLERRSRSSDNSNRSNGSRSASTCRKSYDDLSDIQMEKIDEKIGEELEQRSIKRGIYPVSLPVLASEEVYNEKLQLDNQFFEAAQNIKINFVQNDVQIDGKIEQNFHHHTDFEPRNYSIETNYIRPHQQRKSPQRKENFAQTVSHQITIHFDQEQSNDIAFDTKSVQYDTFSETASKKTSESKKLRQRDQYLESQRKRKIHHLCLVPAFEIQIDHPLAMEEKIENILILCKKYLTSPNFQKSNFKTILQKNFEKNFDFFGPLKPISEIGEIMLHDGIFACSFISFVKLARNSAMMESLMFTQFDEEVGIWTNKQFFTNELKRVKQEREMHYNNEFEKRLKEYQERKAKDEVRKMHMATNIVSQTVKQQKSIQEPKMPTKKKQQNCEQKREKIFDRQNPIISRVWKTEVVVEESNVSVAASSETMTVDEKRDLSFSPIRKSAIQDLGPQRDQSILEQREEISNSFILEHTNISSMVSSNQEQKLSTKKINPVKKRVTKKRSKNNEEPVAIKTEQLEDSADETISQILQAQQCKRKQQNHILKPDNKFESLKEKQKTPKGIIKGSRILQSKDESSSKQKKQKKSPSKKELQKISRNKKKQISKEKQLKNSKSKISIRKSIIRNLDTDAENSNKSETKSPSHKISIQKKALEQKMNQGKAVKFTNSTKGEKNSNDQRRRNGNIFDNLSEDQSLESIPEKRVLRSRSKK